MVDAIGDRWVDIDFNHPLAGCDIEFEFEVVSVRDDK